MAPISRSQDNSKNAKYKQIKERKRKNNSTKISKFRTEICLCIRLCDQKYCPDKFCNPMSSAIS